MQGASATRYASNGKAHLAYQVIGTGPPDLLLIDTWVHHVEAVWDVPDFARFLRQLASFARVIHYDRRGTGLSDPVPFESLVDVETQVTDALCVLDAAESSEAVVLGLNDGTLIAMLFAAAHPERCRSLVLWTPTAHHALMPGSALEDIDAVLDMIENDALSGESGLALLAPSRVGDERFDEQVARFQRNSVRVGAFRHYFRQSLESDVTTVIPAISIPTLVMNRAANRVVPIESSRQVASLIRGARFVELAGGDHLVFSEDLDGVVGEIEEFVTGARSAADPDRILATLLFTDIVDSTKRAAELGDRRWRDLLDGHFELVREELARFGGREVGTTGDGFFAVFDLPAQAIRCAHVVAAAASAAGLPIRAGIHTGEVEVRGSDLGGLAVHIAARIAALGSAGEVLASGTVRELLVGTTIGFEERGEHELKGVPGSWRVFAVTG